MKIEKLLTEHALSSFAALSPYHIATLKRIADGRIDPFSDVSEKTQDLMDDLVNLGMLDATYDLTDAGTKAINVSNKLGSQDLRDAKQKAIARRAIRRKESPLPDVPVDDLGDDSDDLDSELEKDNDMSDFGGTLAPPTPITKKRDNVKALKKSDFETFKDKEDFLNKDDYDWDQ